MLIGQVGWELLAGSLLQRGISQSSRLRSCSSATVAGGVGLHTAFVREALGLGPQADVVACCRHCGVCLPLPDSCAGRIS